MNNLINLNTEFIKEPFKILFYKALQSYEIHTLQDRISFLDSFTSGLQQVETKTKAQSESNNWMRIACGFTTAATIGAFAFIPFPINVLLSVASVAGAATGISESVATDLKLKPISTEIEQHYLALISTTFLNWACLWEYCHSVDSDPNELFRAILYKASRGNVSGDKLIRFDGNVPFIAAIKALASKKGSNYEDVANFVKAIEVRFTSQLEKPQIEEWTPVKELPPVVGATTQLNAIDVPAVPVTPITYTPTPAYNPTPNTVSEESSPVLEKIMASPFTSRAFFGSQRTGKSYLAAIASQQVKIKRGTKIYHLNLASYGTEDQKYWQHTTRSIAYDLASELDETVAAQVVQDCIDLIHEFFQENNAILIVDEIAYLGAKDNQYVELLEPLAKLIADKITTLASSGMKRAKAVWTIAPKFVAGDIIQSAKAVKGLALCYVTIPPGRPVKWFNEEIGQYDSVGFDSGLFDQIERNFSIEKLTPTNTPKGDRVAFIDGKWLSIGNLPALMEVKIPTGDEMEAMLQQQIRNQTIQVPAPVLENETAQEKPESIEAALQNTFPKWNEPSIKVSIKVINLLNKNPERKFKAHEIKSGVADLKSLTSEKAKELYEKLVDKEFIAFDGTDYYSIENQNDEGDDFNW